MSTTPQSRGTKTNLSAEKAFAILEFLADSDEPMRLLDIARGLSISGSTVLRFLATLQNCGYVRQDEHTLKYYITFKLCALANKISSRVGVRDVAAPVIRRLSRSFCESVNLGVEQDGSIVYVDVADGPDQMLRTMQRIGNIAPLHCTGIGKLYLSEYPRTKVQRVVDGGLMRFTDNTITTRQGLEDELERVREQGCAYDNEECELGARCIAVPIRDFSGAIVAGISVTGPVSRLTDALIAQKCGELTAAAREISEKLGYKSL